METSNPVTCAHGEACHAEPAAPYGECLGHLSDTDRTDYLAHFGPGDDFEAAHVVFTTRLLEEVTQAFTEPGAKAPRFGRVNFTGAEFRCDIPWYHPVFDGDAFFSDAVFRGDAWFWDAEFRGCAWFQKARFKREAAFAGARIQRQARFDRVRFEGNAKLSGVGFGGHLELGDADFAQRADFERSTVAGNTDLTGARSRGEASFSHTTFEGNLNATGANFEVGARWIETIFNGNMLFKSCQFKGDVRFDRARFTQSADFTSARFHAWAYYEHAEFRAAAIFTFARFDEPLRLNGANFAEGLEGPIACASTIVASAARFTAPLRLEILAKDLLLNEAHFESTAVLSLRHARVDLTYATTAEPLTLLSHPSVFLGHDDAERNLPDDTRASLTGITGLDGANLVLHDIDLSRCAFSGAYHLDQIRFEGRCTFAGTPRGWSWAPGFPPVMRWTARKVLAEEHAWRARQQPGRASAARAGWSSDPLRSPAPPPTPASIAVLYRQLRKCFEDTGNSPGADDFYYGEMEARRHDPETPWGERILLHAYWLLSGYALRATRALGFLLAATTATLLALMLVGLPDNSMNQQITGSQQGSGHAVNLTISTPDPQLTLPVTDRFSAARAEQAAQIVVNSVIFRSSDQSLTTPGTWIEMTSRLAEPVLLGFAAFAARGRVKR